MDSKPERTGSLLPGLAALVTSAALFYFGTGLTPVPALTWLAPLPVLLLAPRVPVRQTAVVAGMAAFLGSVNGWAFSLHSHDEPMSMALSISVGMAVLFMLAALLFRALLLRGRPLLAALATPALWTGALYVVSLVNPVGLMGTFANDQGDVPLVLQVSSVTGLLGVEFLVLFAPSALAALCAPGVAVATRWRVGGVAIAVFAVTIGYGAVRLSGNTGAPTQRVALIAPNVRHWAVDVGTPQGARLVESYVDQIMALPAGVGVVVLPEGEFGVTDATMPALTGPLGKAASARGVDVVAGVVRRAGKAVFNLAVTVRADGGVPLTYLKHHDLVSPHGHDLVLLPGAHATIGTEVCADVNFANPSRDYATAGARLVAMPAADNDENGWQHSRMALLRGVENGFAVAWAGRSGALMVSDGEGRVLAQAHTGGQAPFSSVVADVPLGPGETVYSRFGDWFAWLCLLVTVGALITLRSRTPRVERELASAGRA